MRKSSGGIDLSTPEKKGQVFRRENEDDQKRQDGLKTFSTIKAFGRGDEMSEKKKFVKVERYDGDTFLGSYIQTAAEAHVLIDEINESDDGI